MKSLTPLVLGAALLSCLSCIENNPGIGDNLIPTENKYDIFAAEIPISEIEQKMADSLSGYSNSRITIGAIRDEVFGLNKRACALTIVPLYDTLNFGNVQKINHFTLSAAFDTTSVSIEGNERILQRVFVNKLKNGIDYKKLIDANDCAGLVSHTDESIVKGSPIIDGKSDLKLSFTDSFAWDLVNQTQGLILSKDFSKYLEKVPGLYIYTDDPSGVGGRINTFDVQMNYNSQSYYLQGNYGELNINSIFEEGKEPVDTSFYFYYGALEYTALDTLVIEYSNGTFPQYAINLSSHESRHLSGKATDKILIEGSSGIKPVITAKSLRDITIRTLQDTLLAHGRSASDFTDAIINKASIVLPFSLKTDYKDLDNLFPPRLSPTCKIWTDTTSTYMGLTDSSMQNENKGDINRSICVYAPDITYHLQQVILKEEDDEKLVKGDYDIWMLLMNEQEKTTTSSSSNSDMSEYMQYLAYQSYYNSMYGGYGGYGGYGSYGSSSYYNNYYSYMLAAMYASGNNTTTTKSFELDKDNYYRATLNGPTNAESRPTLKLVFSLPKK